MSAEDATLDEGIAGTMPAFGPVPQVAGLMRGFPHPWYIAGGWAVDLYLGRETREHDDIDVVILRKDQFELQRYLTNWAFVKVVDGQRLPWTDRERLDLPVHEVHATSRNRARIEFLLNESSGGTWQFRRNLAVTRQLNHIRAQTSTGVPFLAPEIVLLFKAKSPEAKDAHDFDFVHPRLENEPRRWLKDALETCHPGHPWTARL